MVFRCKCARVAVSFEGLVEYKKASLQGQGKIHYCIAQGSTLKYCPELRGKSNKKCGQWFEEGGGFWPRSNESEGKKYKFIHIEHSPGLVQGPNGK